MGDRRLLLFIDGLHWARLGTVVHSHGRSHLRRHLGPRHHRRVGPWTDHGLHGLWLHSLLVHSLRVHSLLVHSLRGHSLWVKSLREHSWWVDCLLGNSLRGQYYLMHGRMHHRNARRLNRGVDWGNKLSFSSSSGSSHRSWFLLRNDGCCKKYSRVLVTIVHITAKHNTNTVPSFSSLYIVAW